MDALKVYALPAPTALSSLLRPGQTIYLVSTKSSGPSVGESWSEAGLFMYLTAALIDTRPSPHGSGLSDDPAERENVVKLLGDWLTACSVDMGKLH